MEVQRAKKGIRDYEKFHCCYFCNKLVKKIGRHLTEVHKYEDAMKNLPDAVRRSIRKSQREIQIRKLRNMGDFAHNINVIQKGHDSWEAVM